MDKLKKLHFIINLLKKQNDELFFIESNHMRRACILELKTKIPRDQGVNDLKLFIHFLKILLN